MRLMVAVGTVLLVAACGTSERGPQEPASPSSTTATATPAPTLSPAESAVDALMRALDAGDCAAARRLVLSPAELTCDLVEQSEGSFAAEGIDLDDVVYRAGAVHGSSSTVSITWGNDYPTESYDLQKVGGHWKVVFDSAA